jgi:hypothetical protein
MFLSWPYFELPNFVIKPPGMAEIYFFALSLLLLTLKLRG